jgi:hypothetical protein
MTGIQVGHADALPPIVLFIGAERARMETVARHFEAAGLWVATSEPIEALDALAEIQPDLVVLTAGAAAREGELQLVQQLSDAARPKHTPIIILSTAPPSVPLSSRSLAARCLDDSLSSEELLIACREVIAAHAALATTPAAEDPSRCALPTRLTPHAAGSEAAPDARQCPGCGTPLDWVEHGRLFGADYDYYQWCAKGCGLYCYNRGDRQWLKLA